MSEELIALFKALSDANRLKIIGLLAQKPYSVEELAALLDLKASTVSHHLARLVKVGLISARAEGYYSVYQLDKSALEGCRAVCSPPRKSSTPPPMWIWTAMTARYWRISVAATDA